MSSAISPWPAGARGRGGGGPHSVPCACLRCSEGSASATADQSLAARVLAT
eukprot:CAMPEP_0185502078 /NCGR_PEP_ID=MMETSP1366-20130426/28165_1 /TAXON_ID=38817 /ORGANISM="Gephyrocapsa oceanica, Strain RCC1303" /LENGTH=50 /DNA_ID=CAMNT_0028111685 /DNA_START=229 /DNA_END=378 /DNA_ORIENTATION=-